MIRRLFALMLCVGAVAGAAVAQQPIDGAVERQLPDLVATYKKLHAAPELSGREEQSSALLAAGLRTLGFEVTEHVGKYTDAGYKPFGVVAVLRNGAGPTVLVRTDMDALPVEEATGLPYASHVRATNVTGQEMPVMHACGHDVHMTCLLGTA